MHIFCVSFLTLRDKFSSWTPIYPSPPLAPSDFSNVPSSSPIFLLPSPEINFSMAISLWLPNVIWYWPLSCWNLLFLWFQTLWFFFFGLSVKIPSCSILGKCPFSVELEGSLKFLGVTAYRAPDFILLLHYFTICWYRILSLQRLIFSFVCCEYFWCLCNR